MPKHTVMKYSTVTQNFNLVRIGDLSTDNVSNGRCIGINRESSPSNRHAHSAKESAIRNAFAQLFPEQVLPFYPFTGSGNLRILRDNDFNSVDVANSYFGKLRNMLTDELLNTPPSQMLFVFVLSPDRLFRSINYDKDKDTWDFCPEDFMLFGQWLQFCFPSDYERIVFVDVSNGKTSEECRSWQIQLGQAWADNKGGRPKKRKQYKRDYFHVAVSLAAVEKMNAAQIRNFLRENHGVDITDRAVRKWLQTGNVAAKRGRPTGIKNGTFHHVDSFTIPSSPHISSVWREVEGMNGQIETLCNRIPTSIIPTSIINR